MMKFSVITILGALLINCHFGTAQVANCLNAADCFDYRIGECDSAGERQVCIEFTNDADCPITEGPSEMCVQGFSATAQKLVGTETATNPDDTAPDRIANNMELCQRVSNTEVVFGIWSGAPTQSSSDPRSVTFSGMTGQCEEFASTCSGNGNQDIPVRFTFPACPGAKSGTPATPAPTTVGEWSNWSEGKCNKRCRRKFRRRCIGGTGCLGRRMMKRSCGSVSNKKRCRRDCKDDFPRGPKRKGCLKKCDCES